MALLGTRDGSGPSAGLAVGVTLALLMGPVACLGPAVGEGEIACGTGGFCPPGYACGGDGRCYRHPSVGPDAPVFDGARFDARAFDATWLDAGAFCGNGVIDEGETCDPVSTCPVDCSDGNACTVDMIYGEPERCSSACSRTYIEVCGALDGCCPSGCRPVLDGVAGDPDCSSTCGNGVLDPGETCDPVTTCPASCDDGNACTADALTGSTANCNVACTHEAIQGCADGDGCCPAGCTSFSDSDCSTSCGNGVIDLGETCDPPSTCPACGDTSVCTYDASTGSAAACNLTCTYTTITSCTSGDGCCPATCSAATDSDCSAACSCGCDNCCSTSGCDDPDCACSGEVIVSQPVTISGGLSPWPPASMAVACDYDGCCETTCNGETADGCPLDCGGIIGCGDGVCNTSTECGPCPTDCPAC